MSSDSGNNDEASGGEAPESTSSNTNNWSKNGFGQKAKQSSGKFSKEESEIVRKAVEDYCAVKQISVARLCSECDHKAELKGSWMEIAKRLPHRSVQSVYRHGLRQLHPFKRGAWTEEECESLVDLVQRMGKKWAAIQAKLNRSADSCRDKYREMSDDFVRGRWKENETEALKRIIREHLNADPTAKMKDLGKMVEREGIKIPWSVISKRMEKRSRLSCFKKWQKMTGLFSPSEQHKHPTKDGSTASDQQEPTSQAAEAPPVVAPRVKVEERPTKRRARGHTAAAAAAAAPSAPAVNNPITTTTTATASGDFDSVLLTELASLGVTRASDVSWEGMRLDNAHERWNELFEEWQTQDGLDESTLTLPLSEVAQLMLDRKTSAQRAAETVEAVDLPNPESLQTRDV